MKMVPRIGSQLGRLGLCSRIDIQQVAVSLPATERVRGNRLLMLFWLALDRGHYGGATTTSISSIAALGRNPPAPTERQQ